MNVSHPTRGFTLIELLIAIAIIGIIAAFALPAYGDYVRRGHRVVAKTMLSRIASEQEAFLMDRKAYAQTLSALGYPADTFYVGANGTPSTSVADALYAVTLSAAGATSFTVQATALNAQTRDSGCTTMSLDNLGQRAPAAGDCWSR